MASKRKERKRLRLITPLICGCTLLWALGAQAQMKLEVDGLHNALNDNVQARLSVIDKSHVDNTPYFKSNVEKEIKKALRALGYYAPRFSYEVKEGSIKTLVVHVDPGEPVLIEKVTINIAGEGLNDKDFSDLIRTKTPLVGEVLNHGVYETFKKSLMSLSVRKGYFDADMTKHDLAVADTLYQAYWAIDFNTGQRYRLGAVTFEKSQIKEAYLRNIIPFKEGDYYTTEQLSLFSRRLSSTNWFSSVAVIPKFDEVGDDKLLPLQVITQPKVKNSFDVGIGYSSDNGVRGQLGWNKPWLNSRGHSFNSNLSLSGPEQEISASYKIPLLSSPLEDYYVLQLGRKKIDNNDTKSNSYHAGALRYWDTFEGWNKALGINALHDNFTQADQSYTTDLIYPSVSFSRVRSNNDTLIMWGDSQRYTLEAASADVLSDINMIRFQVQQTWIRSLYDSHRFVARAHFGMIQSDDFDRVPPSLRFFAGGDRSIRGYSYQSISPKDKNGDLKGASKMLTGSLEYQYNLTGAWWGAVFIDSGEAVDKFSEADFHSGAGFGVRWVSPVGPIKMDIASPLNSGGGSVHFYIGLGTEL